MLWKTGPYPGLFCFSRFRGINFLSMFKAVIFDLNGVFIKSDKRLSERFADEFGVKKEDFMPVLEDIMSQVRKPGSTHIYDHWKPYLERWRIPFEKQQFLDFWFQVEKEVLEMQALAGRLCAKGLELFILSNNFPERSAHYEKEYPFLKKIFKKIYYSWQTGFVKPDPRAFQNLLNENRLQPEECVYFDDSAHNVKVARELGIEAFHFTHPDQAEADLIKLGIL